MERAAPGIGVEKGRFIRKWILIQKKGGRLRTRTDERSPETAETRRQRVLSADFSHLAQAISRCSQPLLRAPAHHFHAPGDPRGRECLTGNR